MTKQSSCGTRAFKFKMIVSALVVAGLALVTAAFGDELFGADVAEIAPIAIASIGGALVVGGGCGSGCGRTRRNRASTAPGDGVATGSGGGVPDARDMPDAPDDLTAWPSA